MEKTVSKASQGHRDACDECHQRKVRCIAANGACRNCVAAGATCSYSPKIPAGRPKKKRDAPSKTSETASKTNNKDNTRSANSMDATGRHSMTPPRHQLAASKDSHNGMKTFGSTATVRHGQLTPEESIDQEAFPLPDAGFDEVMNAFDSAAFCSSLEQDNSMNFNFDQDPSFWPWDLANQSLSSLDSSIGNFQSQASFSGHSTPRSASRMQAPAFRRSSSHVNPVLFQRTISGLMDLVMTLRSVSVGFASQMNNGNDVWLRDDNPIFTSLNMLCDVTEEVVDALNGYESLTLFSVLSQVQMCFYLTHKACVLITDNLQSSMMGIKSKFFRQTMSHSNNASRHHPSRSVTWPAGAPNVQLSQAYPLAMADRLQNTVHMTGAKFQVARLLALLESIIELIVRSEEGGFSLSMVSVDEMRNNCTQMTCLIQEMQTVVDALKSSDQYGPSR